MLKKFFLNILSSFVGTWIALVIFGIISVLVVVGIVTKIGISSFNKTSQEVSKGSVLVLNLSGSIAEVETPAELDYFSLISGDIERPQTLLNLKSAIEAAKNNKNVSALYLKCLGVHGAPATINALRDAITDFKESGKRVIAYGENLNLGDYYLASAADEVYLNPSGRVMMKGLGGLTLFYKGLLDKLGVEMQVVKVGTFKSAVEPFILTHMSEPARAQLDTLYDSMWDYMCNSISKNRNELTASEIDSLVSNCYLFTQDAQFCLQSRLVDHLLYERSMDSVIASKLNVKKEDLNFVSPSLLDGQEQTAAAAYQSSNQIAILYATGDILDGGGKSTINYERMVPLITSLAENDKIKGMVLRVNSPGGSAFGSDQIGEALDYFQSKGKPLAVSMGDYAASGGYWISCCADRIFADPLTITGSIGIFGMIPNVQGLMHKLGLNVDLVSSTPKAEFPNLMIPLDAQQLDAMQHMVEHGYDQFVARVARGRKMPESRVREIGEGRVWNAIKAKEIGLVDELGGLSKAVEWVAQTAKIENYGMPVYPKFELTLWDYLPELADMSIAGDIKKLLGEESSDFLYIKAMMILMQSQLQARMPYGDLIFTTQF